MVTSETSFYVAGGALSQEASSYVVRQADADLYEGLTRGEFCYVLTSRQMGKSSLMVRTAARLREAGVQAAVLDLTAIGQNLTAEQWYGGLLNHVGRQFDLEEELDDFWLGHERLGPLQRWIAALEKIVLPHLTDLASRLVIFIDEIDAVRSLPFPADEFLAGIRECYNRRTREPESHRLTFCLLGVATPPDLIQDARTTPFNIGRRIELTDFTAAEAAPLAKGLGRSEPEGRALLQRVLYWTGGHPYLTQRLCQAVAQANSEDANPKSRIQFPKLVERCCAELFLSHTAQEQDNNLLFVRERLLRSEADPAGLLDLYVQVHSGKRVPDDDTNRLVSLLRLTGVVRSEEACVPSFLHPLVPSAAVLRVRNRIYARVFDREWITAHMPDAELRRQRAAFRRGLMRAGAVAGLIVAVMTALVLTAVRSARRAEEASESAKALAARLRTTLGQREAADRRLRQSLAGEQAARHAASGAADRARTAERSEHQQRVKAEAATRLAQQDRQIALQQQRIAEQQREASRQRLVRMNVAAGTRVLDDGNLLGSLPWFAEALRLDHGHPAEESVHRMRLAAVLQQCPKPVQIWFHQGRVWHAAFSPDGRRVVTASNDQTAQIWDVGTGRPVTPLLRHHGAVFHAAFSPDGRRVVTSSDDRTARIWDATTGRPVASPLRHRSAVLQAAFSPDGRRVITAGADRTARVWDAGTGRPTTPPLPHGGRVVHAAFSPDGRRVVTASADHTARIWDAATGAPVTRPLQHLHQVWHAEFSPDGSRVVTASLDFTARVWNATTGQPLASLQHRGIVAQAAFSPDGRRVVTASSDETARVWDAATGAPITPALPHHGPVEYATFSPDGRRVVTASSDQTARVWDAATGQPVSPPLPHQDGVGSAFFSPDGRRIVTASADRTVRVWDLAAGVPVTVALQHWRHVWHAAFSPDGRRIVTTSDDYTARVWDAATGASLTPPLQHDDVVPYAAFSPDGRRIVTASWDATARVWDARTGRPVTPPLPHRGYVGYAEFSPDGRRIVTAAGGFPAPRLPVACEARVWDAATGHPVTPPLHHGREVLHAAFSPDGRAVVTAGLDGTARVWNAATGRPITPPLAHRGHVAYAEFSPDGRRIVTVSGHWSHGIRSGLPGEVRVWEARTGRPVTPPLPHRGYVGYAEFSPDGRRIVTASGDTASIWELRPDRRPVPELERLAQLLAGHRIDVNASSMFLPLAAVRTGWQSLSMNDPEQFTASLPQVLAWYRREAADAMRAQDWPAVLLHLDRLIAAEPSIREERLARAQALAQLHRRDEAEAALAEAVARNPRDTELWIRRGDLYAEWGQWEKAANDFARAIELGAAGEVWAWHALARLGAGDTKGYRRACVSLLARFSRSDDRIILPWWILVPCVLAPDAVPNSSQLVTRAEKNLAPRPKDWPALFLLELALYRAGRFDQAVRAGGAAIAADGAGGNAFTWSVLAMAHQRLGHAAEARRWLARSLEWESHPSADFWSKWYVPLVVHTLNREAESLAAPAAPY